MGKFVSHCGELMKDMQHLGQISPMLSAVIVWIKSVCNASDSEVHV